MIASLLIGRAGSRGVPNKNTMMIMGRPLMTYPIIRAKESKYIDRMFLSTDCPEIMRIGREYGLEIIEMPADLCTDSALVEDVVVHGFNEIEKRIGQVDILVLQFCNSATLLPGMVDKGIELLKENPEADSAVTVSPYNEFSPVRAKKIDSQGYIVPYVDVDSIENASCDRDSAQACYFCDCSLWVLRRRCITDIKSGILPFRWMGRKSLPLYQNGGLDIDHDYGIAMTEHWLKKYIFEKQG